MPLIRTQVEDRVAVLTLDDVARRNAISLGMAREIATALDELEASAEVGALVVTGAPPAFCAGADLTELEGAEEEGLRQIYSGFLRLRRSPLPTIAAVNGPAVGAGVNLAMVCDMRLAARSARFDSRFLALGLHPGGGHCWMLQQALGPMGARALVLFGEVLDGEGMARMGLAWRCVEDGELLAQARLLAARAAAAPADLVLEMKETLRESESVTEHGAAVELEVGRQVRSLARPEFVARLEALREKLARR
jgi:enoyl-CoA hydratase